MARTTHETPGESLARIQSGFSKNDPLVIHIFASCGIAPEDIEPRINVLVFDAWKALGRRVARGAMSVRVPVLVPAKGKKGDETEGPAEGKDGKRSGYMLKRTAKLFHISQTVPLDCGPDDRPSAWDNPKLVRPGTYEQEEATEEAQEEATTEPAETEFSLVG